MDDILKKLRKKIENNPAFIGQGQLISLIIFIFFVGTIIFFYNPQIFFITSFKMLYEFLLFILLGYYFFNTFKLLNIIIVLGIIILWGLEFLSFNNKHSPKFKKNIKELYLELTFQSELFIKNLLFPLLLLFFFIMIYIINIEKFTIEKIKFLSFSVFIYWIGLYFIFLVIIYLTLLIISKIYKIKLKPIKKSKNYNYKYLLPILLLILLGVSVIMISNLNKDYYKDKYINCNEIINTYPINYYYIQSNSKLYCNINESIIINKTILILFENSQINQTINLTENSFIINIPNINQKEKIIIKDEFNKTITQIGDIYHPLYIIEFNNYLEIKKEIETKKLAYFFGSWVIFFILIQFIISFDNWLKDRN